MKSQLKNHFAQCRQAGEKILMPEHVPAAVKKENDRARDLENDQPGKNQMHIAPVPPTLALTFFLPCHALRVTNVHPGSVFP
jgi:hypothetical protein